MTYCSTIKKNKKTIDACHKINESHKHYVETHKPEYPSKNIIIPFTLSSRKRRKQSVKEVKNVLEIDWKRAQGDF